VTTSGGLAADGTPVSEPEGTAAGSRPWPALGGPIDKASPVPLYFQIAENFRLAIEDHQLQPGERLENELLLSERLGVSRPTVRRAVQHLAQEGLVVRQRGVGTVVVNRRIQRPLMLSSLYEDLKAAGREPMTAVLAAYPVEASAEVARALGVAPRQRVLMVERLRSADGLPLAIMRNYLPETLLRGLDVASVLASHGLYDVLRSQGIRFHSAEEVIGARRATAAEAKLFQAPRNSTVLTMTRVATDPSAQVIEYGVHAYLAERYTFRIVLGPDSPAGLGPA
jgi:DNA-binding GntR family transcriptional regulator